MKKLLSSVSLAALALCLTLQASYAMKRDADGDPKYGKVGKKFKTGSAQSGEEMETEADTDTEETIAPPTFNYIMDTEGNQFLSFGGKLWLLSSPELEINEARECTPCENDLRTSTQVNIKRATAAFSNPLLLLQKAEEDIEDIESESLKLTSPTLNYIMGEDGDQFLVLGEEKPLFLSSRPSPLLGLTYDLFQDILGYHILPFLSETEQWSLKLVSRDWMHAVNSTKGPHITSLDLSPRSWVPFETRDALMAKPLQIFWKDLSLFRFTGGTLSIAFSLNSIGDPNWLLCKPAGKSLWRSDHLSYGVLGHQVSNPFAVYESNLTADLKTFPNLRSLMLKNNTAITDDALKGCINLTSLDLGRNIFDSTDNTLITDKSVRKLTNLTNLTNLNITGAPHITGNAFAQLTKLAKLTINMHYDIDYSACLECPQLKKLRCHAYGERMVERQHEMYFAEKLFVLIDEDGEKRENPEYQALRRRYEIRVLLPNYHNLGELVRKSTYPFDPNKFASIEDDVELYSADDLTYIRQVNLDMSKYTKEQLNDKDKNLDHRTEEEPLLEAHEWTSDARIIIAELLKIRGRNLEKISWK